MKISFFHLLPRIKSARIRSYSSLHSPPFGLNTERYGVHFSVTMCLIKLISKYMQVSQIVVVFQASKIWRNVFSVQKIIFQRSVYKIKKYNFRTVSQPMRNIESRNSSFNLNLNLNLTGSIFSDSVSFLFLVTGKSHYETKS